MLRRQFVPDTTLPQARDLAQVTGAHNQALYDAANAPALPPNARKVPGRMTAIEGCIRRSGDPQAGVEYDFYSAPQHAWDGQPLPPEAQALGVLDVSGSATNYTMGLGIFVQATAGLAATLAWNHTDAVAGYAFAPCLYKINQRARMAALVGGQTNSFSAAGALGLIGHRLPSPLHLTPGIYATGLVQTANTAGTPGKFAYNAQPVAAGGVPFRAGLRVVSLPDGTAPLTFSLDDASVLPAAQWPWVIWLADYLPFGSDYAAIV